MEFKLEHFGDLDKELKCTCCGKLLSVSPIYCAAPVGNICGRCSEQFEEIILKGMLHRASSYELVAKYLEFPCSNQHFGCKASLKWPDVQKHESNCSALLACPMEDSCSWQGTNISMLKHICTCHSSLRLQHPISMDFLFRYNDDGSKTFYTKALDQYFLVKWKIDDYDLLCDIKCVLTHHGFEHQFYGLEMVFGENNKIDSEEQANDMENFLDIINFCASNYIHSAVQYRIGDFDCLFGHMHTVQSKLRIFKKSEDEIAAIEKKYNVMKPLNKEQIIDIISKHQTSNLTRVVQDLTTPLKIQLEQTQKFLEELECPVCGNYMSAPIYLCLIGHTICKQCKPKVLFCTTCRSKITDGRNLALENLSGRLQYTCKFAEFGCKEILKWKNLGQHIKDCLYRTVRCFFNHCNDNLRLLNVKNHFLQKHS